MKTELTKIQIKNPTSKWSTLIFGVILTLAITLSTNLHAGTPLEDAEAKVKDLEGKSTAAEKAFNDFVYEYVQKRPLLKAKTDKKYEEKTKMLDKFDEESKKIETTPGTGRLEAQRKINELRNKMKIDEKLAKFHREYWEYYDEVFFEDIKKAKGKTKKKYELLRESQLRARTALIEAKIDRDEAKEAEKAKPEPSENGNNAVSGLFQDIPGSEYQILLGMDKVTGGAVMGEIGRGAHSSVIGSIGHLGNATFDPGNKHSSNYISTGIHFSDSLDIARGKLDISAGLAYTYYDEPFENRQGDDRYLHDFTAQFNYTQELNPSAQLGIDLNLNYNEHGNVSQFVWGGALDQPVFHYTAGVDYTFRADGGSLTAPGIVQRVGLHVGEFRESGGDFADSHRYETSYELINTINPDESIGGFYARFAYGGREWKEMDHYDSTHLSAVGGIFGTLPCGANYRIGAGAEFREYDGSQLDDRTVPTVEAFILGEIGKLRYSIGGKYGIHDKFANWSGANSIDMEGLEIGAHVKVPLADKLTLGIALELSYLDAESSDFAMGHVNYLHGGLSLGYQVNEQTSLNLSTSLDRVSTNNGGSSLSDTYHSYHFSIKHEF